MENIHVSIIIPAYNAEKYIIRTLNSVINQNFEGYEIVFIDNGSGDDTLAIAQDFLSNAVNSQKIANFSVQILYFEDNQGPSIARNKGMEVAKGDYFVFLDDDDTIATNHLNNLYNAVISNYVDSAFIKMVKVSENNQVLSSNEDYNPLIRIAKTYDDFDVSSYDLIKLELMMEIPFSFVQLIYDKNIINNENLIFNENIFYGEDTDFALRYLAYCNKIHFINENSYFYYQVEGSITSNAGLLRFDFIPILEDLANYYENLAYFNPDLIGLISLIRNYRIPKAIFGNMNYLFYYNYDFEDVISKMNDLDLFNKLSKFETRNSEDRKFLLKIKSFLISPKLYYKFWKRFKNKI